jgi:hypothetical protein
MQLVMTPMRGASEHFIALHVKRASVTRRRKELLNIFFMACGIILLWCGFMLIRNQWVYKTRMKWIDEDIERYRRAKGYDAMVYRFWNWSGQMEDWKA